MVAFLLYLFIARGFEIARQLRTDPAVLKGITSIYTHSLPTLTCVEDSCLQLCIDVVKSHCTKIDIFDRQASAGNEVVAYGSKGRYRIRKILTDIRAKYGIH